MLFFSVSNSCDGNLSNVTLSPLDSRYLLQEWYLMLCILPVSFIAIFANAISLYIFTKQCFDCSAVRFNLLSISISEIILQIAVIAEATIVLGGVENVKKIFPMTVTSVVHLSINATSAIRNWNVVLISVARCEVVLKPMSSRVRLMFNTVTLRFLISAIVLVSMVLACLNILQYKGNICKNLDHLVVIEGFLDAYEGYRYFQIYGLFMFQSCLPVLFILTSTITIWCKLHRSPQTFNAYSRKSIIQNTDVLEKVSSHRLRNKLYSNVSISQSRFRTSKDPPCSKKSSVISMTMIHSRMRTSYLVLFLSIMFCVLQIPTFIITCVVMFHPTQDFYIHPDVFSNSLLVIDSLLNVFVYAASSKKFRDSVLKLFSGRLNENTRRSSMKMSASFLA